MKKNTRKWIVGLVVLLAFLIVVGIFSYYYNTKRESAKSEGTLIMQPGIEALWR